MVWYEATVRAYPAGDTLPATGGQRYARIEDEIHTHDPAVLAAGLRAVADRLDRARPALHDLWRLAGYGLGRDAEGRLEPAGAPTLYPEQTGRGWRLRAADTEPGNGPASPPSATEAAEPPRVGGDGSPGPENGAQRAGGAKRGDPPTERDYHIQVRRAAVERLRIWLAAPNGAHTVDRRLTIEAVEGGGLLFRARPFRYADREAEDVARLPAWTDEVAAAFRSGRASGWIDGVRWAAGEADARASQGGINPSDMIGVTDHLRLCASAACADVPNRPTAVNRDQAPETRP